MPVYPYPRDYPKKVTPTAGGGWVVPGWTSYDSDVTALTPDVLCYTPIFVCEPHTYVRIGVNVTIAAAGGSLARLGIYAWGLNIPGGLILDAGTVAIDAVALPEIVIAQTLPRGYYFLAIVGDAAATLKALATIGSVGPIEGWASTCDFLLYYMCLQAPAAGAVAGGLPDPGPGATGDASSGWAAYVMLRQ